MRLSGCPANWNFFTAPSSTKRGRIRQISTTHAVLCCHEPIENRRWIRVAMHDSPSSSGLTRMAFARVLDQYEMIDLWEDESLTLYRHEIEWIEPINTNWAAQLSPDIWDLCDCSNLIPKQTTLCGLCALRVVIAEA